MGEGAERPLTQAERALLSGGLLDALDDAGVGPILVAKAHPFARVAALWLDRPPILARPGRVFWPGAPADAATSGDQVLAVLQHELQHLLEYALGELGAVGYLSNPRNWRYGYRLGPDSRWSDFAAEQRACIAEHFWLLQRGRGDLVQSALRGPPAGLDHYRRIIPWA